LGISDTIAAGFLILNEWNETVVIEKYGDENLPKEN